MRPSRFTEEQIIGMLKKQEAGGRMPQAGYFGCDLLQVQGQVRRNGRIRRPSPQGAGGRECTALEALGRADAGQRDPEGRSKK